MPDISPTSAYLSDSEMIAWLQAKENDQYGKLREQMDASSDRGALMKDLTDLRASIDNNADPQQAFDAMQTLVDKYKNSPEAAEVDRLLLPAMTKLVPSFSADARQEPVDSISNAISNSPLSDDEKANLNGTLQGTRYLPTVMVGAGMASAATKELSDKLKSETDELGRIDQLALINIQQVMSDARQTDQLASNILSSRDQASNSIVGNIRG